MKSMIPNSRSVAALFSIVFLVTLTVTDSFACSCFARPTLLDSYESSKLVVTTKLASVEKIREKSGKYDVGYIRSAKMVVEKVYKGTVKVGDELIFAQGGGADCIWTFDEEWIGDEFLFYLGSPTKGRTVFRTEAGVKDEKPMYHAVTCGRSRGLKGARRDVSYLENFNKLRGKTRISGTLNSWYRNSPNFANIDIKIIGKNETFTTKTDKSGFYEIYGLPPGEYLVEPTQPFGWRIDLSWLEYSPSFKFNNRSNGYSKLENRKQIPIVLNEKRHAELDLFFEVDAAMSGKIVSPTGRPLKGVRVSAIPVQSKKLNSWANVDYTNEAGEFLIDTVSPGNYVIVVNSDGKLGVDQPFYTLFVPGVSERKKAEIFSIKLGQNLRDIELRIPKFVDLVEIRGKVMFSDRKPFSGKFVRFKPNDNERFDSYSVKSDENGEFEFRLPKGSAGELSSDEYVYVGEFKNCDKLDDRIKKTGKTSKVEKTTIRIDGMSDLSNIELVFPFPFCEKEN